MSRSTKKLMWVVGAGGAAPEHALPRLANQAEVYAFVAGNVDTDRLALLNQWCADVTTFDLTDHTSDITSAIVSYARRIGADGIVALSELTVLAVAEACQRLGLPGPGPNTILARDKWRMRERWAEAGLPVPRFTRVATADDLAAAARKLRMPFLLKPCGRGGGIGQQIIDSATDLSDALHNIERELGQADQRGYVEHTDLADDLGHYVAEEIIDASVESWYDDERYGDYLSVEGIVAGGVYHPIAIMARLPTLPSFAETAALSPTVLREDLQRKVEKLATDAVNALGLETCGTHTEIKLMAGERMCLIESSARPAGAMGTLITEAVFGVDMIGLLAGEALGEPQEYPDQMLIKGIGAAAVLFLVAADPDGKPWPSDVPFHWKRLDWSELVSVDSRVEVLPSQLVPDGTVLSPYRPGSGSMSYAGSVVLHSASPEVLVEDSYRLLGNLEAALRRVR